MGKLKLTMLKPRLQVLNVTRLKSADARSRRWSGRKLQDWRKRILAAEPLCRHCAERGVTTAAEDVDHMVPLEFGGTYEDSNACPLCKPCHKAKTAKDRGYKVRTVIGADGWPV